MPFLCATLLLKIKIVVGGYCRDQWIIAELVGGHVNLGGGISQRWWGDNAVLARGER